MNGLRSICIFFVLVLMAGCASFTDPARKHELDASKPYWMDYDAYRRGALFVPLSTARGKTIRTCSEPPPDVAMQLADKFTAKGGSGEISAEASAEISQNALQLAQRTQTIQFLRESLFRLCELSINSQLAPDSISILYGKVLDAAKSMAEAEKSTAEKAATDAQNRLAITIAKAGAAKSIDDIKKNLKEKPGGVKQ
jgi:hypothetical protein